MDKHARQLASTFHKTSIIMGIVNYLPPRVLFDICSFIVVYISV